MSLLHEFFSILKLNIVLMVFLLALLLIAITMRENKQLRYASFLVVSAYIICTILNVAAFVAFMWYFALPVGLLLGDLIGRWTIKQLKTAEEEEKKGGYGLTKKRRMEQMEQYLLNASPVELNRVKQFEERPVAFQKPMFMAAVTVMGFLIAAAVMII